MTSQLDQYTTSQPSVQIFFFSLLLTADTNRYNFWNREGRGKADVLQQPKNV